MREWFNRTVLKTVVPQGTVSSNLTPTAFENKFCQIEADPPLAEKLLGQKWSQRFEYSRLRKIIYTTQ